MPQNLLGLVLPTDTRSLVIVLKFRKDSFWGVDEIAWKRKQLLQKDAVAIMPWPCRRWPTNKRNEKKHKNCLLSPVATPYPSSPKFTRRYSMFVPFCAF